MKKYIFNWKSKGETVLFLGNIHGDEICGYNAMNQIIDEIKKKKLTITKWKIIFIPTCNPLGLDKNQRQINVNLNRIIGLNSWFKYEDKLNKEICTLIKNSNLFFDIHAFHTNWKEFVFVDYENDGYNYLFGLANIKYKITWRADLYEDDNSCDTIKYWYENWKHWITVECWKKWTTRSNRIAYNFIKTVLGNLGIINYKSKQKKHTINIKMYHKQIKEKEWKLLKKYKNLDKVFLWEQIWEYIDWEKIICQQNWYILLPHQKARIWDEWFYLWI